MRIFGNCGFARNVACYLEPAKLNGMKLIFKTLAAGLFAFSMANAQDDVPADAAFAPASDKPTLSD